MNIFRRIVSIFMSCFRARKGPSMKTQDDMAAANVNCKSQLLPQTEGHDKHSSSDPSHVESKTYPYGDHRGMSEHREDLTIPTQSTAGDPQRDEWAAAEISRLQNENAELKDRLKREKAQSTVDCAQSRNDFAHAQGEIGQLRRSNSELQRRLNNGEAYIHQLEVHYKKLKHAVTVGDDEIKQLRRSNKRLEADELALKNALGLLEAAYSKISECGSYYENSATPTDASEAFSRLSIAVDSFSKQLRKFVSGHPDKVEELRYSYGDVTCQQSDLRLFLLLKAKVMKILFEGFENESFNLDGGYCVYSDPVKRKKEFFALFLDMKNNKRGPGSGIKGEQDDQFVKYYERSKARVWEVFALQSSQDGLQSVEPAFMKAALSVWALHLLSFSFEPPASLFRIQNGAEFDRAYMVTPVFLEFDEDLVEKVEFMLTPGLRVDKFQTIKSEIHPVSIVHDQK